MAKGPKSKQRQAAERARRQVAARQEKRAAAQQRPLLGAMALLAEAVETFAGTGPAVLQAPLPSGERRELAALPTTARLAAGLVLLAFEAQRRERSPQGHLEALLGPRAFLVHAAELLGHAGRYEPELVRVEAVPGGAGLVAKELPPCLAADEIYVDAVVVLGEDEPTHEPGRYVGWLVQRPSGVVMLAACLRVAGAAAPVLDARLREFEAAWNAARIPEEAAPVPLPVLVELALAADGHRAAPAFDYEDYYGDGDGIRAAAFAALGRDAVAPEFLGDGARPVAAPYHALRRYDRPGFLPPVHSLVPWVGLYLGFRAARTLDDWDAVMVRIGWPREQIARAVDADGVAPVLRELMTLLAVGALGGTPRAMPLAPGAAPRGAEEVATALLESLGARPDGTVEAAADVRLRRHPLGLLLVDAEGLPGSLAADVPIHTALAWAEAHPAAPAAAALREAFATYRAERRWLATYGLAWDPPGDALPVPWWDEITHALAELFDARAGALPLAALQARSGEKVGRAVGALGRAGLPRDATLRDLPPTDQGLLGVPGVAFTTRQGLARALLRHLATWRLHEAGLTARDVARFEARAEGGQALSAALDDLASLFEDGG